MKFDILKWAYEAELPPAIKGGPHAVLVALAYSAHYKTEKCFPSIKRLIKLTRLKDTAVKSGIKILEEQGLITKVSGKGKKTSNRYTINYHKIEKKDSEKKTKTDGDVTRQTSNVFDTRQTRQTSTDSDHEYEFNGSHSDRVIGCNATTNKENNRCEASVCSSSNKDGTNVDDEHTQVSYSCMKAIVDGEEVDLFLGKGKHKPIGLKRATKIVNDWFQKNGEKRFLKKLEDMKYGQEMVETLSNTISMFTEPPIVGFNDIEKILNTMKESNDWYIIDHTIENVKAQASTQQIENPRAYIMKAIEENIANGTADLL